MNFVYNSSTRTFSNSVAGSPSTTVLTNLTIGGSITNLYNNLAAYPLSGVLNVVRSGTNALIITTLPGTAPTITIGGAWGNYSISSGTATNELRPFLAPFLGMPSTTGVFVASEVVTGLGYATNQASATNYYLTNFVNRSTAQTVAGAKTFSDAITLNGAATVAASLTLGGVTTTTFQDGAAVSFATNTTILGYDGAATYSFQGSAPNAAGVARFGDVTNILGIFKTNAQSFTGTNTFAQITNSLIVGSTVSNSTLHGTLGVVTGGTTNLAITNATTYGDFHLSSKLSADQGLLTTLANSNNLVDFGSTYMVKAMPGTLSAAWNVAGAVAQAKGIHELGNATGFPVWVMHESGVVDATNRVRLPAGTNLISSAETTIKFYYDSDISRWRVTGYTPDGIDIVSITTNILAGVTNIAVTNSTFTSGIIRDSQIGITNGIASRAIALDANTNIVVSATTSTELGYLSGVSSALQTQLNAKGTVSSVAFTGDGVIHSNTVTGSPITTTGTLSPSLIPQATNLVLVGPASGSTAAPTFRRLQTNDIPGGINATNIGAGTVSTTEFGYLDGVTSSIQSQLSVLGTVSSVALTVPSILSVSGSPVTGSGTLAVTLATETANTVFAGPALGSAATPTFRAMVSADIAGLSPTFATATIDNAGDSSIRLNGSATGNPYLDFRQNGTQVGYIQWNDSLDNLNYNAAEHYFSGGNVGIGNNAPTANLDVSGTFAVSGNSSLATITAGTWNGTAIATAYIAASGVSAATYGGATNVPVIAVDVSGRITSASNVPITNLNAAAITGGTFAGARLGSGTLTSATYLRGDSTWQNLANSHTHLASEITSGFLDTARLGSGSASANTALWGDGSWHAILTNNMPIGSTNISVLGTVTAGTWTATPIAASYIGAHTHAASDIVSGALDMSVGGTGAAITPVAGAVVYSSGSVLGLTAGGGGSANKFLISNGNAAPSWYDLFPEIDDKSPIGHTHAGSDIVSGTVAPARLAGPMLTLTTNTAVTGDVSTSEHTFLAASGGTWAGSTNFPTGWLASGRVLRVTVFLQKAEAGGPTFTLRLKINGTTIIGTAITVSTAVTMRHVYDLVFVTTGASGSVTVTAVQDYTNSRNIAGPSTVSVDLSGSNAIGVSGQWSALNAANVATLVSCIVEAL